MLQQTPAPKLGKRLTKKFFDRSAHSVAPDLIGATLLVDGVGGIIVEVEAYHHTDPPRIPTMVRRRATA
jgi:DNA-3-methyladenine glycosylase